MKFYKNQSNIVLDLFGIQCQLEQLKGGSYGSKLDAISALEVISELYKSGMFDVSDVERKMDSNLVKIVFGINTLSMYITSDRHSLHVDISAYRKSLDSLIKPAPKIIINHKTSKIDIDGVMVMFKQYGKSSIMTNVSDVIDQYIRQKFNFTPYGICDESDKVIYEYDSTKNSLIRYYKKDATIARAIIAESVVDIKLPYEESDDYYIINDLEFPKGGSFLQVEPSKSEVSSFISFMKKLGYRYTKTKKQSSVRSILIDTNKVQIQSKFNELVFDLTLEPLDMSMKVTNPSDAGFKLHLGAQTYDITIINDNGVEMFGFYDTDDLKTIKNFFSHLSYLTKIDSDEYDQYMTLSLFDDGVHFKINFGYNFAYSFVIEYSEIEGVENIITAIKQSQRL